jgi:hypothetical protein
MDVLQSPSRRALRFCAKPHHEYREVEMAGFNELLGTGSIACRSGDGQFKKLINSIKEFYLGGGVEEDAAGPA